MQIPHWKFTLIKLLNQKLLDRNRWGPWVRKRWSLNSSQAWVCKEHFALQLSPSTASVVGWPQLGQLGQMPTQLLPSKGHGEKVSWKQKSGSSFVAWICCKGAQHLGWINYIVSLECPLCKFDSLACVFVVGFMFVFWWWWFIVYISDGFSSIPVLAYDLCFFVFIFRMNTAGLFFALKCLTLKCIFYFSFH